jgi:hypothetical protein
MIAGIGSSYGGDMDRIGRAFRDHPASVGETYGEHLRAALGFSLTLLRAAAACAIHAFLPFLFVRTGSTAIESLHARMVVNRRRSAIRPPQHETLQNRPTEHPSATA